jgi:hypothetical protein
LSRLTIFHLSQYKAQTSCGQSHACLTKVDSSPRPYMPPNNDPQTSCHREADRSVQTNHRYYLNPQSIWAWVHSQKPMSIGFFCHVMIYEANDTTEHENKLNKTFHKKKKKKKTMLDIHNKVLLIHSIFMSSIFI